MQVRCIPFVGKRVGVQVKLRDPLTTRAIPQRFCSHEETLFQVSVSITFPTFTRLYSKDERITRSEH